MQFALVAYEFQECFVIFGGILYVSDHVGCKQGQFYVFFPNLEIFYFIYLPYCISKDFQ